MSEREAEAITLLKRLWRHEQARRYESRYDRRSPRMTAQMWTRRGLWGDVRRFLVRIGGGQ